MARAAINRELSLEEQTLLKWLIENGMPEAAAYVAHIPSLRVVGGCECGCPTVDLALDGRRASLTGPHHILADFLGTTPEGVSVGVILHARGDQISELEIYSLTGTEAKFGLPTIDSLHSFEATPRP